MLDNFGKLLLQLYLILHLCGLIPKLRILIKWWSVRMIKRFGLQYMLFHFAQLSFLIWKLVSYSWGVHSDTCTVACGLSSTQELLLPIVACITMRSSLYVSWPIFDTDVQRIHTSIKLVSITHVHCTCISDLAQCSHNEEHIVTHLIQEVVRTVLCTSFNP